MQNGAISFKAYAKSYCGLNITQAKRGKMKDKRYCWKIYAYQKLDDSVNADEVV